MEIIAGDIGGTNARLAICRVDGSQVAITDAKVFSSSEFSSLADIVTRFMADRARVAAGCFAVPGPVRRGKAQTTNLPWTVESARLAEVLGLSRVELINDLEANAYGLAVLPASDLLVLREGTPDPEGNAALISAGTGLGQAGLYWDGRRRRPFASEGGHTDFAPTGALQRELHAFLAERFPKHVSWERVLSGPGLFNLYQFLRDSGRGQEQAWVAKELEREAPPKVIGQAALAGKCDLCRQALTLFCELYGAEAGNLALTVLATAGVYLGGGIAPKIAAALKGPEFLAAFDAKGRLSPLMNRMPVYLVLNDRTALLGSAHLAAHPDG